MRETDHVPDKHGRLVIRFCSVRYTPAVKDAGGKTQKPQDAGQARSNLLKMIEDVAAHIATLPSRAIVAIDGVDGAGKTTYANDLMPEVERLGRPVVRASIDGFHNPKAIRYLRGKTDPTGFFLDSFNYPDFVARLLRPFGKGLETIETSVFCHRTDGPLVVKVQVPANAVLIVDGIFLHRDELASFWDFSIFLDVPFETSFRRVAARDGSDPNPQADSNKRYYEGQMMYLLACRPADRAHRVIAN